MGILHMQMSKFALLDLQDQKDHVLDLARAVLLEYPFEVQSIDIVNFEFNATFKVVTKANEMFALRINVNSDRTYENLLGEIAFVRFLNDKGAVNLPKPIASEKGEFALTVTLLYWKGIWALRCFRGWTGKSLGMNQVTMH